MNAIHYMVMPEQVTVPNNGNTKLRCHWMLLTLLIIASMIIYPRSVEACYTQAQIDTAAVVLAAAVGVAVVAGIALGVALAAVPIGWLAVAQASAAVLAATAAVTAARQDWLDKKADPCCPTAP